MTCSNNDKQTQSNLDIVQFADNMTDDGVNSGMEVHSSDVVVDDSVGDDMLGIENEILVPKVGMIFDSEKEIFEFYKNYAYEIGFPVRKGNSKKGVDGVVRYVSLTCSREGRRKSNKSTSLKPPPTIETGCKAKLTACTDARRIWQINVVQLEHNHKISPSKSRLYRCNRELSAHVKRWLEGNDIAGIPLHKNFNSTVVEAGGFENMTCVEKDRRNFIDKVWRLRFGEGDAVALHTYFSKMQTLSPGFYFSMDLDEESRLRNMFWANNRCRQAYKEFSDVVTFDTTYLTNKYDMSFAPFVGVNHHRQSNLFGCESVSNEDTNTFVWLFRTWLECMHGQAPGGIITDQDRAMQNAIQIDEEHSKQLMAWIELQMNNLLESKCNRLSSLGVGGGNVESSNIFDLKCTKRKSSPKKLRIKSSLEMIKKTSRGRNKVPQVMNISYSQPPQSTGTQDSVEVRTSLQ